MATAKSTVLLVDDDRAILRIVSHILAQADYEVIQAQSGEEALAKLTASSPDFLLTDLLMPGMSGLELCRKVRALPTPHYVYIVLLTAKVAADSVLQAMEAGADDFVGKGSLLHELLPRLKAGQRVLELERRLSQAAGTDVLTGLPTRRTFHEACERELSRSRRYQTPLSAVMLDIDYFKRINDVHGHAAGDAVLRTVAGLVRENCRGSDFVGRHGGEEFSALLPQAAEADAATWADRLRQTIAATPITIGDRTLNVTISLGVAAVHDDTQTPEKLLDLADQALLVAKRAGRNRVVCYSELGRMGQLSSDVTSAGRLFERVLAGSVMSPIVVCLRDDDTLAHAAEVFLRYRVTSSPVVGADGRLVGMVSESDLLPLLTEAGNWQRPLKTIMKTNVVSYDERDPVEAIYQFLCRVSLRRVVVVRDGFPVGVISRGTVMRWCSNLLSAVETHSPDATGERANSASAGMELLTDALVEQSTSLRQAVARTRETDDALPAVINGVSQIQELLNDMLSCSTRIGGAAPTRSA